MHSFQDDKESVFCTILFCSTTCIFILTTNAPWHIQRYRIWKSYLIFNLHVFIKAGNLSKRLSITVKDSVDSLVKVPALWLVGCESKSDDWDWAIAVVEQPENVLLPVISCIIAATNSRCFTIRCFFFSTIGRPLKAFYVGKHKEEKALPAETLSIHDK